MGKFQKDTLQAAITQQLWLERVVMTFLLSAYAFLLLATVSMLFLIGFKVGGFVLSPETVKWLCEVTARAVIGLLTLTISAVWRRRC